VSFGFPSEIWHEKSGPHHKLSGMLDPLTPSISNMENGKPSIADNASTDNTKNAIGGTAMGGQSRPFVTLFFEPQPGLGAARDTDGGTAAAYIHRANRDDCYLAQD